jgi:hypothetical protein
MGNMKNLSVYITPAKKYEGVTLASIRIWIDNSLALGWKKEDIILINNFPFEYNGVKSTDVGDKSFCPFRPGSSKTCAVADLLEEGFMGNGIYWVHDPDAYQLNVINEEELELEGFDVGFTTYGWSPKWCLGSYFVKKEAKDIFKSIKETVYEIVNEDERALVKLTSENRNDINKRIKTMNITYQIGQRHVPYNYNQATKPIKVLHFRPQYKGLDNLATFMYGKSELGFPLMSERLIELFHHHGIK